MVELSYCYNATGSRRHTHTHLVGIPEIDLVSVERDIVPVCTWNGQHQEIERLGTRHIIGRGGMRGEQHEEDRCQSKQLYNTTYE